MGKEKKRLAIDMLASPEKVLPAKRSREEHSPSAAPPLKKANTEKLRPKEKKDQAGRDTKTKKGSRKVKDPSPTPDLPFKKKSTASRAKADPLETKDRSTAPSLPPKEEATAAEVAESNDDSNKTEEDTSTPTLPFQQEKVGITAMDEGDDGQESAFDDSLDMKDLDLTTYHSKSKIGRASCRERVLMPV